MIARRSFVCGAAAVVVMPSAGVGQTAHARVGVLSGGNPRTAPQWAAFEERLRELGYADGQRLTLDFRDAVGRSERMPDLAHELAAAKPDVLVASGPEAALKAVKQAAATIPIVMIAVDYDPIALGHVAALARPAGNVTGLFFRNVELTGKRLELLTEVVRGVKDVAVFWDDFSADQLKAAQVAAQSMRVRLHAARNVGDDLEAAFRTVAPERPGALLILASPRLFRDRKRLAELALKYRLPAIGTVREYADAGVLMSYGVSFRDMFRRAAEYVARLLGGARPADLPVEQPARFELVANVRTATALGLAMPPSLRLRADHLIE